MLEIQQWLEDILSKVTKHDLLQLGAHLGLLPCNNQVMAMCNLEHILDHLPSTTCLSLLIPAILLNLHLVVIPPIGNSQLVPHLSRLLREVVTIITVNSSLHSNSKPLVVLQHQQIILVTITLSHHHQAIISRDKVILKMAMVGMHPLNLDMVSHHHMISSKVTPLLPAMGM